jgi:TRAP-type C4-dicarboxylate transport system permease small subunit
MRKLEIALENYLDALDWPYIFTFMLIAYFLTDDKAANLLPSRFRKLVLKVSKTIRVIIIGILYATALYFIRDYHGWTKIEGLIQSLVFAMVFYGAVMQSLIDKIIAMTKKTDDV